MITTVIVALFLGIVSIIDNMLGAILPLRHGVAMFQLMLSTVDNVVYYVRSIFPLTISTIFFYGFLMFSVFIVFKFINFIKSIVPYLNRFGSGKVTDENGFITQRGVGDTRGGWMSVKRGKKAQLVKVNHWQDK